MNEEFKLCGECSALWEEGSLSEEDLRPLRPAKGGRPHKVLDVATTEPEPEPEPEEPEGYEQPEEPSYSCAVCGKTVKRGQRNCSCSAWLDWRGTDLETDTEIVICPRCGAVCGYVGQVVECPHCSYEGD